MADEKPAEKPTVELPKVPEWAIELTRSVKDGFRTVETRLDTLETNLDIQGSSVRDVGKRMTSLEERVNGIESRQNTNSIRARSESQINIEQSAELVKERDAREALAIKVDQLEVKVDAIHKAVSGFFESPKVRFVGKVLFGAAMAYAAAKGIRVLP